MSFKIIDGVRFYKAPADKPTAFPKTAIAFISAMFGFGAGLLTAAYILSSVLAN